MDTGRPATRQAVRAGIAPAPPPIRGMPSRSVSSTRSLDGAPSTNTPIKTSRPVTPELSFSSAVSGRPPSTPGGLGDGSGNTSPGLAHSEPDVTSNVPPLSGDVDFGLIAPDEEIDEGWTSITRRTARTHSLRPVSPVEDSNSALGTIRDTPTSESTLNQVEANMSKPLAAARRKASSGPPEKVKPTFKGSPVSPAVPSGEGSSKTKGKGLDPRNFGAVPSLIDFTEDDLAAQREALANVEEINGVIKQESVTPELGLFDDAPLLDLSESTSEEIPHPSAHKERDIDDDEVDEELRNCNDSHDAGSEHDGGTHYERNEYRRHRRFCGGYPDEWGGIEGNLSIVIAIVAVSQRVWSFVQTSHAPKEAMRMDENTMVLFVQEENNLKRG
ncbi:hypothetical protein B0H14DRAFT_3485952 [Mycena olivaceomarginata]|nr:hypothetical protein B0H14DRAFT_3485952 [Mycena olivaceomarginata]